MGWKFVNSRNNLIVFFITSLTLSSSCGWEDAESAARRAKGNSEFIQAQFNQGLFYFNGQGVPVNYPEAAKWYRKAAETGIHPGQSLLGEMYRDGRGVPQDCAA